MVLDNSLLTTADLAVRFGVNRTIAAEWCRTGVIPATKIGNTWLVRSQDVVDFHPPSKTPGSPGWMAGRKRK